MQHWQLRGTASILLEAAGPLTVLLAQVLYFSRPFLGNRLPADEWQALTKMLENQSESRSFAAFLREEESR